MTKCMLNGYIPFLVGVGKEIMDEFFAGGFSYDDMQANVEGIKIGGRFFLDCKDTCAAEIPKNRCCTSN